MRYMAVCLVLLFPGVGFAQTYYYSGSLPVSHTEVVGFQSQNVTFRSTPSFKKSGSRWIMRDAPNGIRTTLFRNGTSWRSTIIAPSFAYPDGSACDRRILVNTGVLGRRTIYLVYGDLIVCANGAKAYQIHEGYLRRVK